MRRLKIDYRGGENFTREDGVNVTIKTYAINSEGYSPYYYIKHNIHELKDGSSFSTITINKDRAIQYLPDLYCEYDENENPVFTIQTASYGALTVDEIDNMIDKLSIAQRTVEILEMYRDYL